ncbi:hypothetical protein GCM10020366_60030 [Saccharopolyspora gregorii]|uniref:Uncharacterized protein n=1 Tax=Saccharopolyspora gregorii TaxID=33914 RepID=A0ABP6RZV3_9PSEU
MKVRQRTSDVPPGSPPVPAILVVPLRAASMLSADGGSHAAGRASQEGQPNKVEIASQGGWSRPPGTAPPAAEPPGARASGQVA